MKNYLIITLIASSIWVILYIAAATYNKLKIMANKEILSPYDMFLDIKKINFESLNPFKLAFFSVFDTEK